LWGISRCSFQPGNDREFDVQRKEEFREQQIRRLVDEVTEESAEWWLTMLSRCAHTESNDLATFPAFQNFLEELGRSKSHIICSYLDRLDDRLTNFLPSILLGLQHEPTKALLLSKVRGWIDKGLYLRQIMSYLRWTDNCDGALLEQVLNAAMEASDDVAVLTAVAAAAAHHNKVEGGLVERLFIPAVNYLKVKEDGRWVNAISMHQRNTNLLRDLNPDQVDLILSSLIRYPQIDYGAEEVLVSIAEKWPKKVIDFFGLRSKAEKQLDAFGTYEAIPYAFHKLHDTLAKAPGYLLDTARSWFEEDKRLFTYRGGLLISKVFPNFSPEFERCLKSTVRSGRSGAEFVLKILRNYHGQPFIHDIGKELVEALPVGDPLLDEVEMILDATGMVSGEFGLVEALTRKRVELEPWLSDARQAVRSFAARHQRTLDRKIAAEQRRSDEELELRKRDYGEQAW
jgi:hypothetical protein